tara:strand:+ start:45 stop:1439 length:1395 start_codon:yes stop_codon:yes gene_type:complete
MSILTYNPKAKPGDADYWGDVYGDNSTNNQFPVGNWQAGEQTGNLRGAKYYTVVNKENGDIAVVKSIPGGTDITIGTIDPKDGNNFTATKDASTAENQYFEHPVNASTTKNHAERIAQNAYDLLGAPEQAASTPPYNLLNDANPGTANWDVNANNQGVTGVSNSVAPQNNQSGNSGNYRSGGTGGGGGGYMVFPSGADSSGQDLIKFSALEFKPSEVRGLGFGEKSMSDTRIKSSKVVFLPIPGGISDGNSASWSEGRMDAVQIQAAKAAIESMEGGAAGFEGAMSDTMSAIKADDEGVKRALKAKIGGALTGTNDQLLKRGGEVMNPNMELLFDSPSLRSFSFTFKLSPRTSNEAKLIARIIRCFKSGMAPKQTTGNLFLQAPDTWKIQYLNGDKKQQRYLNKFKECAMTNFTVNYAPDGSYATYEPDDTGSGSMVSYELGMSFQEISPVFEGDYLNEKGVGY